MFKKPLNKVTHSSLSALRKFKENSFIFSEFKENLTAQGELWTLARRSVQLYNQGEFEEALQPALKVRELSLRLLGKDHPFYPNYVKILARVYQKMGRYDEAEPLLKELLEIFSKTKKGNKVEPDLIEILNYLAELYLTKGEYDQAEKLLQEALEKISRKERRFRTEYFVTVNSLVVLYTYTDRYVQATALLKELFEAGTSIRLSKNEKIHHATHLNNLGVLYCNQGIYFEAEPLLKQVLEMRQENLGIWHPDYAESLNNLAALYYHLGDYVRAEPLYQKALEIIRAQVGEVHPDYALSLNNLALVYDEMGNYSRAEALYHRALEIRLKKLQASHPDVASSLNNLGQFYFSLGNYTKAETLLIQAGEIFRNTLGTDHSDYAISLNNLARLYSIRGEYERAEPLFQNALEIWGTVKGKDHPSYAAGLGNLASLYLDIAAFAKAETLYKEALEIESKALGKLHPEYIKSLNSLAVYYDYQGEYAKAESLYTEALSIAQRILDDSHPHIAKILTNLALLFAATNREFRALELLVAASRIAGQVLGQIFSFSSESQRMNYLALIRKNFYCILSLIVEHFNADQKALNLAFELVMRYKAIGAEATSIQRDEILSGKYPELLPKFEELNLLKRQLAWSILNPPGIEKLESHQKFVSELVTRQETLESQLARQIPEMDLNLKLQKVDCASVVAALPEKSVLIEFVFFNKANFKAVEARQENQFEGGRYLAFVVLTDPAANVKLVDLGEAGPIEELVNSFHKYLDKQGNDFYQRNFTAGFAENNSVEPVTAAASGQNLRTRIFDPLKNVLEGCQHLYFAPDGVLCQIPFEVLPLDHKTHLIDNYEITYLSVGRDLPGFRSNSYIRPERVTDPLIIADPDFDLALMQPEGEKASQARPAEFVAPGRATKVSRDWETGNVKAFPRLPGTLFEGQQIASMLKIRPLMGKNALEGHLKGYSSPQILHLATHGFFLPDHNAISSNAVSNKISQTELVGPLNSLVRAENPLLRSGLALAGANTWCQGGVLPSEAEDGILTALDVTGLDLTGTALVVLSACDTGQGQIQINEGIFGFRRAFVLAGAGALVMSLWKVPDEPTKELMVEFYQRLLRGDSKTQALRAAQLKLKSKYIHPFCWGAFICQGDPCSIFPPSG